MMPFQALAVVVRRQFVFHSAFTRACDLYLRMEIAALEPGQFNDLPRSDFMQYGHA